jgi:hypothetical protein
MTNTPAPTDGPGTEDVLALAAIIIEVQGGNRLGAGALAEAILSHPCSRWLPATSEASHTVEPPGCPMPGACSCPIERSPDAGLVRLLLEAAKKYEEQLFSAPPGHQEALDTALKSLETNHDLD